MTGDTVYNCTAYISDAEHSAAQLTCAWQTILHRNNHTHNDPVDSNCTTTATISPVGCDGETYYYEIVLTVTDAAGLSTAASAKLYPACTNYPPQISTIADQTINEDNSTGSLPFVIGDVETAATSLIVTGSSSNPALVPNANIIFGGSGSNR